MARMISKTITIELENWQVERMRSIINALKDLNRTTDDKADITYDQVQQLDGADHFLAERIGLEQPKLEHGGRNWYADYVWEEEETDD